MLESFDLDHVIDEVIRGGNRDAFRWIIRAYSLPIRSFIASQVLHLDEVDDLAQEVFIAAYRSLDTFCRGSDFGAWLRGIAKNKLLVYFRGLARRSRMMDRFRAEIALAVQSDLERAVSFDYTEMIEMLLRCVDRLPDKLRRVVRAGLEGRNAAALADELTVSVGAVYALHYRANRLLRACLVRHCPSSAALQNDWQKAVNS